MKGSVYGARRAGLGLLATVVAGVAYAATDPAAVGRPALEADASLRALLADEWATRMRDDPLYATQSGVRDYDNMLPAVTPADFGRRERQDAEYARRLAAIERAALSAANRVN